ncbi:ATP-binding protein [Bradyrhizobium sp.]|jgi:PAS domain S-box-containing protein|uniref:ATP-binding protein n=1 Tax=Bradyrhizobium sp. TaxID=376 RepID=UPI003C21CA1E
MTATRPDIVELGFTEEMFRLAVEACPSGMMMVDHDGRIVMVNTEIERQFGYTRGELIGQAVDVLVPERLRSQHVCHRHNFTPKPESRRMGAGLDLYGRRKDGSEFPVEVGLNPIHAGGNLLVLAVIVDISQRKHIERLKDEFVSTVSHELRTPMTSIAGSLGLLVGQWSDVLPESATRLVSIAHKNIQRLVRLINDILDIEKLESGAAAFNFAKIELRLVAEQAIEDTRGFADGFGVKIRLHADSAAAPVNADPDRLVQVITNLLSNAIKFSPAGGEVVVTVENRDAAKCRLAVRDFGPGISAEFRPHIFEKFAQADGTNSRRKGGTGLGLSIVKQIVERLGGQVGFDDAPGGGTVFHVDLPAWDESAGGEIDIDVGVSTRRVLFCDDDPAVTRVIRMRLRAAGFAVDFAHSPDNAVLRANATRYAAILVDLRLRETDGIDLILSLRALPYHGTTPIVVISGDIERGRNDVRSPRLNILAWFSKPIDFTRLARTLQAATSPISGARPCVLHIDDDLDVLALVARRLEAFADVMSVNGVASALSTLDHQHVDLVILEIDLGKDSGLDLLPELRDVTGNVIPVIVFSAHASSAPCDGQIGSSLCKTDSSLDDLPEKVGERLAFCPAKVA